MENGYKKHQDGSLRNRSRNPLDVDKAVFPQPDPTRGGAYRWYWRIGEKLSKESYASKAEAQAAQDAVTAAAKAPEAPAEG